MKLLIAEIGNNHFGDIELYKEHIAAAIESGADLVKGQAFKAVDLTGGSMDPSFYSKCQLDEEILIELIRYARLLGGDMFFSIFSSGFKELKKFQKWDKYSASQVEKMATPELISRDKRRVIMSVPKGKYVPHLRYANLLHVSDYLTDRPNLKRIKEMRTVLGKPIGYSDHTIGIQACLTAISDYGSNIIEKHFTLEKSKEWRGVVFRDTVHGCLPDELKEIAKELKEG